MKVRTVFHGTVLVEMTHSEFRGITGVPLAYDQYGNGRGAKSWGDVQEKEFVLENFIDLVKQIKVLSELKASMINKLEEAKTTVSSAFWPLN